MARIGFIGVGNMGTPMAVNLVTAGYAVLAYDVVPTGVQQVVAAGGRAAASLAQVASESDVVVSMLPSPTRPSVAAAALRANSVRRTSASTRR